MKKTALAFVLGLLCANGLLANIVTWRMYNMKAADLGVNVCNTSRKYWWAQVVDESSASDCDSTGGGTTPAICYCNGSAWVYAFSGISGAGETNTASNLGGGLANYSTKVGVDLRFNSFDSADFDLASNLISIDPTKWAPLSVLPTTITCSGTDKVSAYNSTTHTFTCTTDQNTGGGGGGAPTTASYVTTSSDAGLSNEFVLQNGTNTTVATGTGTVQVNVADASTSVKGVAQLATPSSDTTAGHVVQASDARLSDSRPPTGSAGGGLTGTYPNPGISSTRTGDFYWDSPNGYTGVHFDDSVASMGTGNSGGYKASLNLNANGGLLLYAQGFPMTVPTCAAGVYYLYPNAGSWKMCTNGTASTVGGSPTGPAGGDLTGTYPDPDIAADAVALGTDTTGNYADSDAEAGPALHSYDLLSPDDPGTVCTITGDSGSSSVLDCALPGDAGSYTRFKVGTSTSSTLFVGGDNSVTVGDVSTNYPALKFAHPAALGYPTCSGIGVASDRLFGDLNCNGTKDTGEEYLDNATGGGGGSGTVTSVDMTVPTWLAVSGNPITTSGTLAVTAAGSQPANYVLATPNGSTGAVSLRALTTTDLPAGTGTVTSVAQTVPSWLTVTGSPITTNGTLAISATTGQTANRFLATPNGSTGAISLRALVAGDMPAFTGDVTSAAGTTVNTLVNIPNDTTMPGWLHATAISTPAGTPAAGTSYLYQGPSGRFNDKNSSGVIGTTVTANTCTGNDKVSAITTTGGVTCTADQNTTAHSGLTGLTTGDDHTQYALLSGRTPMQTLINAWVKNGLFGIPGQGFADYSMTGLYDRNELTNAALRGTVTFTFGGGVTNGGASTNYLFDATAGNYWTASTVTSGGTMVINIDMGANLSAYSYGVWSPFVQYRLNASNTATGSQPSFFKSVSVEVSPDNSTWYAPGSNWSTTDFAADQKTSGLWIGAAGGPGVPGTVFRYIRFSFSNPFIDPGYSFNSSVWISEIGLRIVGAPYARQYASTTGDTFYGDVATTGKFQIGSAAAASATCIDDASDHPYGDLNCNGTKDSGEKFMDASGGVAELATSTSADLRGVLSDETGTGAAVFGTAPTITLPTLTLKNSTGPVPTNTGDIQWDNDDNCLVIGNGTDQTRYCPSQGISDFVKLKKVTNQAFTTAVEAGVSWDGEVEDTSGFHDNTTNNVRITIPAGHAGVYFVTCAISFASASVAGNRVVFLYDDLGNRLSSQAHPAFSTAGGSTYLETTTIYRAAVGQYFTCGAYQNSGGNLNVNLTANTDPSYFAAYRLDPGTFGQSPPYVKLGNSGTETFTTAVEAAVTWNTETEDNSGLHSTGANTDRVTVTQPGLYLVTCNAEMTANATGLRMITGWLNNTTRIQRTAVNGAASSNPTTVSASGVIRAVAGDFFNCQIYQNSGGNLDMTNSVINTMTVTYIGSGGSPVGSIPYVRVYKSGTQALTTAVAATILFDAELEDASGLHSTTVNTDRVTVTQPGVYRVDCQINYAASATVSNRETFTGSNGSSPIGSGDDIRAGINNAGIATNVPVTAVYHLAASDYVTCSGYQNTGGNLNVLANSSMTVTYLGQ